METMFKKSIKSPQGSQIFVDLKSDKKRSLLKIVFGTSKGVLKRIQIKDFEKGICQKMTNPYLL